jgi:hypothetical protein
MKTFLYLKEVKPENLIAAVELEVVPRGIYQVKGKKYIYNSGQPTFVIHEGSGWRDEPYRLVRVELIVEEYVEPSDG